MERNSTMKEIMQTKIYLHIFCDHLKDKQKTNMEIKNKEKKIKETKRQWLNSQNYLIDKNNISNFSKK